MNYYKCITASSPPTPLPLPLPSVLIPRLAGMFSKVKLEKSNEGVIAIDYSEPPPKAPEMIYMTEPPEGQGPLLLLPEESCLAEDEKAVLELHCTRPGFHLFGLGDVTFKNVPVKVYLTNYRVRNPLNCMS